MEAGVAEAEHAAVGGHQPVALAVGGGGHAHHGPVEAQGAGGPVEAGVAEAEDAAVRGHQPVAATVGGGGGPDHRPVEAAGGALEGRRAAEGRGRTVVIGQPATARGGGGDPDHGGSRRHGMGRRSTGRHGTGGGGPGGRGRDGGDGRRGCRSGPGTGTRGVGHRQDGDHGDDSEDGGGGDGGPGPPESSRPVVGCGVHEPWLPQSAAGAPDRPHVRSWSIGRAVADLEQNREIVHGTRGGRSH